MPRFFALLLLTVVVAGCARPAARSRAASVREWTPAFLAGVAAANPALAVARDGRIALTWVVRGAEGSDVYLSTSADSGGHWAPPVRLDLTAGTVSSFTESRPAVAFGDAGRLVVAWAAHRGGASEADDIVARASDDGGAHFGAPSVVNDDASDTLSTYHGFLALESLGTASFLAAWIDGRTAAANGELGEPAAGEVWSAVSRDGGRAWSPNTRLADSVCACCRIELRARGEDVALAYRGFRDGMRDPRLALSRDGGATFVVDTLVSRDGWRVAGCPSHGPTLALAPGGGRVAWFTAGEYRRAGTWLADWRTDGRVRTPAELADGLRDPERPRFAGGDSPWLGVIARPEGDTTRTVWAVKHLEGGTATGAWTLLGTRVSEAALASNDDGTAWAAWTEDLGEGRRLRVARLFGR